MRRARRLDADQGVGRKADHDHGVLSAEGTVVEIERTGTADQLHGVGPEQAELIGQQFRHAAAAAKSRDPDPVCRVQRTRGVRNRIRGNSRKPCRFGFELVVNQFDVGIRPAAAAPGAAGERRALRRPSRL
ncbi:hypothetical protein chiPu_0032820, partial [Chiloscyllium punctatum]|nr:hypothetical protein [Chiloscyllium punctatum]